MPPVSQCAPCALSRVRKPKAEGDAAAEGGGKGDQPEQNPKRRAKRPSRAKAGKQKAEAVEGAEVKAEDAEASDGAAERDPGAGSEGDYAAAAVGAVKPDEDAVKAEPGTCNSRGHLILFGVFPAALWG